MSTTHIGSLGQASLLAPDQAHDLGRPASRNLGGAHSRVGTLQSGTVRTGITATLRTDHRQDSATTATLQRLRSELDEPPVWQGEPRPAGLAVTVRELHKSYGAREVLAGIDLDIAPGEFVAIVGRSGCGKSTLLRLLAGLEQVTSGRLELDGQPLAAQRDALRMMFQDARLLPWKSVLDNIALGLDGHDALDRARQALAQVGLGDRAGDWPAKLSGGQRQRVALARALVHTPRLLLLDEPLGALDALTRIEMQQLIEDLWRRHGFTAVLVTHDVSEAVALADRVILIDEHRVTLDQSIDLPRPRSRGNAAFAALEDQVLQQVLETPRQAETAPTTTAAAGFDAWRFSV